jgi:polyhydroxyalkanoate synthase
VVDGTPVDLGRVTTPAYVQAGREDHIAPAASVWKLTTALSGPVRFVLAGSGHIAGVVNPPAAGKYQYWTLDPAGTDTPASLDAFIAAAVETKGSWWPDWVAWLRAMGDETVAATGARIPGEGALPALGESPGDYVRMR